MRVVERSKSVLSPWVTLVAKTIELPEGRREVYHSFQQRDYVTIVALTADNKVPLIRQFRPAVEELVWELPAGLVESDEQPIDACRRELKEEVGLTATEVVSLGKFHPDTGRLENAMHIFFARAGAPDPSFTPESGTSVKYVDLRELLDGIYRDQFCHALHIAAVALAFAFDAAPGKASA